MTSQTRATEKGLGTFIFLKPFLTLVLYTIGFVVGFVLLFFDYLLSLTTERHHQFLLHYQAKLWLLLLIVQTMFWAAVCAPIWRILVSLKREFDRQGENWKKILFWPILFPGLLFPVLFYLSSRLSADCGDYGFPHSFWKTRILTVIGFLIAFITIVGLLLISIDLVNLESDGSSNDRVSRYIERRRHSLRLLTILGVMTSLATLGLGAKRNAIIAMGDAIGKDICPNFTPDRIFLHAIYLTILLALAFFPIYVALLRTGRKIVCDLLPMPSPSNKDWPNWYARQKSLEELLQLSVTENLRAGIAILAPIAGSLISLLKG